MSANELPKRQVVAVLQHHDDTYGTRTAKNAVKALGQARIDHVVWDIAEPLPDLGTVTAILICTECLSTAYPGTCAALERFVHEGGGLAVIHRGLHADFCDLFGIVDQDRAAAVIPDYDPAGLCFPSRALPSFEGLRLDASLLEGHASFDIVPVENARVVATTWTGKPLAWRTGFGKGYVLYWNTTIFSYPRTSGLIVESLQSVLLVSVVPMANVGVVQVDDFPAPLAAPTAEQAGSSNPEEFYSHTWWPDIHRLAERYGVALSCYAMFDYTNERGVDHSNPFSMIDSENCAAIMRLPPAEIGLHGYNHLPLAKAHWQDQAEMVRSLNNAIAEWRQAGLGPLPTSYVPPMNVYDREGISALVETIPSIQTISGALKGIMGGAVQQEFGQEPCNEALFRLPRATCGCECSQEFLFDCASEVAALGVWTHYLHPDDLMDVPRPGPVEDPPRNPHGRPWRGKRGGHGLYDQLAAIFDNVKSRFPWLVYRATTEGAAVVKRFLASEWQIGISENRVVIDCPAGRFFRLRTNGLPRRRIVTCDGAEILHELSAEDYCLYVIEARAAKVEVVLADEVPEPTRLDRIFGAFRSGPYADVR